MKLNLDLPPELATRLQLEAERQGVTDDALTIKLLNEQLPQAQVRDNVELIALLQSWIEEEPDDEDDGYDFYSALDAARPSHRKLYPPELKGISW